MVHWTPQHWPVSLLGYPQNCLSNVWSFRTMGSQPQDNFIDHKITAFMNWLIFLHTIIFLLSMPLTVATFTSCHVLGTSLAAHWPATRQLMPARRMALWSHLPCLSGLVPARHTPYCWGKRVCFTATYPGKACATECSVLMAVVTMDASANLFLHLICCVAARSSGRSLQMQTPPCTVTYLHLGLHVAG